MPIRYTFRRPGTELIHHLHHQRPPLPPAPAESPPLRSPRPPPRSQGVVGCPLLARVPRARAHRRTPASLPTQDRAAAWHGGPAPRRRKHGGSDLVSASGLSGGPSQRQMHRARGCPEPHGQPRAGQPLGPRWHSACGLDRASHDQAAPRTGQRNVKAAGVCEEAETPLIIGSHA